MKKANKLLFVVPICLLLVVLTAALFACGRNEEPVDEGIKISFVTGFEDKGVTVPSIVSTLKEPGSLPEDPFFPGWEFCGWYLDANRKDKFDTKMGLTGDTTLYALWEQRRSEADEEEQKGEVVAPTGVKYRLLEDDTYAVVGYDGKETVLTIAPRFQSKSVTVIKEGAFSAAPAIEKIVIPSTVNNIEEGAFKNLSSVRSYEVNAANVSYSSYDGVLYNKEKTAIVAMNVRQEPFTLAKAIKEIKGYAFAHGKYEVILPEGGDLTVLDKYAFAYFDGKIELGKNVREIRQRAFYESAAEVTFADDCKIDKLAMGDFDSYKGKELVLPSSIKSLSGFPFSGCTAKIDMTKTGIVTLGEGAFGEYKGEEFVVPYFVETIERNCFYHCTAKIVFDERSTYSTVKEQSFIGFYGEVFFPYAVTKVEKEAFYEARYARISFARAKNEIVIEENAFYGCDPDKIAYGAL